MDSINNIKHELQTNIEAFANSNIMRGQEQREVR